MNKIEINGGEDTQATLEMIQHDIEAEGYDITCGVMGQMVVLTCNSKTDLANFICTPEFREHFFAGASVKAVKAKITKYMPIENTGITFDDLLS